jgi:hypothetical protein
MGIGLAHDSIGQVRYPARMPGSATAREARHGEIKASPEEMHRARLAKKRAAKIEENIVRGQQDAPKPRDVVAVVRCVHEIPIERNRIDHLVRNLTDAHLDPRLRQQM